MSMLGRISRWNAFSSASRVAMNDAQNPFSSPRTATPRLSVMRRRLRSKLLALPTIALTAYLIACPFAIRAIAVANWRGNVPYDDPTYSPAPRAWVEGLFMTDLAVAVILVICCWFWSGAVRWIAIAGVPVVLFVTFLVYFEAAMATTGMWL